MSDASSVQEKLLEKVARAICQANEQNGGPPWDHPETQNKHAKAFLMDEARAAVSAVFDALHDVTPEMVEAVARCMCESVGEKPDFEIIGNVGPIPHWMAWIGDARAAIIAYLAASPLNGGK